MLVEFITNQTVTVDEQLTTTSYKRYELIQEKKHQLQLNAYRHNRNTTVVVRDPSRDQGRDHA